MKSDKKVLKALVMISQLGITILVPIFMCVFVGIKVDAWLGTNFITMIGILLGIVVAFRNVYIMTKQFYARDKAREDAELKYIKELKQKHQEGSTKK